MTRLQAQSTVSGPHRGRRPLSLLFCGAVALAILAVGRVMLEGM